MALKNGTNLSVSTALLATTMHNTRGIMFASLRRIVMNTIFRFLPCRALDPQLRWRKCPSGGEREGQTPIDDCPLRFRRKVIVGRRSERGNAGMIVPPLAFGGSGK